MQAGYTWSKSLDDVSAVSGGTGSTGALALPLPQNPFDTHPEKGPSNFDVAHSFSVSAAQDLHLQELGSQGARARQFTGGWQLLSISSIFERGAVHGVFGDPADRRGDAGARIGRIRLGSRIYRRRTARRGRGRTISARARGMLRSFLFRWAWREGRGRTMAGLGRWGGTRFGGRRITTSTTR